MVSKRCCLDRTVAMRNRGLAADDKQVVLSREAARGPLSTNNSAVQLPRGQTNDYTNTIYSN